MSTGAFISSCESNLSDFLRFSEDAIEPSHTGCIEHPVAAMREATRIVHNNKEWGNLLIRITFLELELHPDL